MRLRRRMPSAVTKISLLLESATRVSETTQYGGSVIKASLDKISPSLRSVIKSSWMTKVLCSSESLSMARTALGEVSTTIFSTTNGAIVLPSEVSTRLAGFKSYVLQSRSPSSLNFFISQSFLTELAVFTTSAHTPVGHSDGKSQRLEEPGAGRYRSARFSEFHPLHPKVSSRAR